MQARCVLGDLPRCELQLSGTRSGTDEARRKGRRHLRSSQEWSEDEDRIRNMEAREGKAPTPSHLDVKWCTVTSSPM